MFSATDLAVRNRTYGLFADLGRAPSLDEAAKAAGRSADDVWVAWQRLADGHAIVLPTETRALRMASPFSAVETDYRVSIGNKSWYANCAWDAFGICAALHCDGRIDTSCADCRDPITVNVVARQADDDTLLFHCLVAAVHWWDDIVFTPSSTTRQSSTASVSPVRSGISRVVERKTDSQHTDAVARS